MIRFTYHKLVCLVGFFTASSTTRLYCGQVPRLTILQLHAATHDTERGDHDSQSHYIDTDPTSRERAATVGIKPRPPQQESRSLPTQLLFPPSTTSQFFFTSNLIISRDIIHIYRERVVKERANGVERKRLRVSQGLGQGKEKKT